MTNEECRKLVLRLHQARMASHKFQALHNLCEEAAAEIERLEKENGRLTQALIDELAKPKRVKLTPTCPDDEDGDSETDSS
jgi:hypothetical protein